MPHQSASNTLQALRAFITPKRSLLAAFFFFFLMVAIGSIPGEAKTLSAMVDDRLLHFSAYFFLSLLIYGGLRGSVPSCALRTLLLIGLLGGLDEAIQSLMPYRTANSVDWAFDQLAALSCVGLLTLLHMREQATSREKRGSDALDTPQSRRGD